MKFTEYFFFVQFILFYLAYHCLIFSLILAFYSSVITGSLIPIGTLIGSLFGKVICFNLYIKNSRIISDTEGKLVRLYYYFPKTGSRSILTTGSPTNENLVIYIMVIDTNSCLHLWVYS